MAIILLKGWNSFVLYNEYNQTKQSHGKSSR